MFKLNTQLAKSYDERGGFINQAGKYIGKIESAVFHIGNSAKGRSENVFINFVTQSKQKARFCINVSYSDGIQNDGGIATINALLACLRLHESGNPVPTMITEFNKETKCEEKVQRDCFVQMHNKPIGIVVQMVHEDGQEYPSPTLYSLFEPSSEMTASEILNKAVKSEKLEKIMAFIANKPLIDKRKSNSGNAAPPRPPRQQSGNVEPAQPLNDIDDDIPF